MAILAEQAKRLALHLSGQQLEQFAEYTRMLAAGNRRANLTAITEPAEVQVRHYLDSLTAVLARADWPDGIRVVDIGAGAGFPGVPLKIAFPSIKLTLAESTGKKTAFLGELVEGLGLDDVEVLTVRAEELGRTEGYRGQFDVALARGVATLPALIEYGLPLLKGHGHLLAWKGSDGPAEVKASAKALAELGGEIAGLHSVKALSPPLPAERWIVSVEKVRRTPGRYPRRVGVPAKQPL
ncbi:MAG: 16S rRNA (guanine(527)-N(7))-methyltransferase RsmG [Chloroflexi bacterium]|nr:16S rRNA (guanine(527)-N(7))-methyltransferase RsmG [Chloroflexota bacterium]MYD47012.1 16S rRNA (guanine(527)-N(7))-methyltransferase RsmG [Chloroflexota bacterium]